MNLPDEFTKEETYFTVVFYDDTENQWFVSNHMENIEDAQHSKQRFEDRGNSAYIITHTIVRTAT